MSRFGFILAESFSESDVAEAAFKKLRDDGTAVLVDVRTLAVRSQHIHGSINIPLSLLKPTSCHSSRDRNSCNLPIGRGSAKFCDKLGTMVIYPFMTWLED